MGIPPDFAPWVHQVTGSMQKKDAMEILKHSWSQLSKKEKGLLKPFLAAIELAQKTDGASKQLLHEITDQLKKHPELKDALKHLHQMVSTPKKARDDWMEARKTGAGLLEAKIEEAAKILKLNVHLSH